LIFNYEVKLTFHEVGPELSELHQQEQIYALHEVDVFLIVSDGQLPWELFKQRQIVPSTEAVTVDSEIEV